MSIATDAFFAIGASHAVCQDYACARESMVALSDGCSSSPDTDVGARALALQACALFAFEPKATVRQAHVVTSRLALPTASLDATLLVALFDPERQAVEARLWGDGVIAARLRGGGYVVYRCEHAPILPDGPTGAPFYLSYWLDIPRQRKYLDVYGAHLRQDIYHGRTRHSVSISEEPEGLRWSFPAGTFDLVVLMSDGASSFQRRVVTETSRSLEDVPLLDVVEQVLAVQGSTGAFLQRRCRKFLRQLGAERGWQHADDFAAAAIFMEAP